MLSEELKARLIAMEELHVWLIVWDELEDKLNIRFL
jgi:hypothetical protein